MAERASERASRWICMLQHTTPKSSHWLVVLCTVRNAEHIVHGQPPPRGGDHFISVSGVRFVSHAKFRSALYTTTILRLGIGLRCSFAWARRFSSCSSFAHDWYRRTFNRMLGIIIPLLRCWFALQRAQAHGEIIDLTDLQIKSLGERSNKGWETVSNVATSLRCWEDALNWDNVPELKVIQKCIRNV